jgi:hypothetical protein
VKRRRLLTLALAICGALAVTALTGAGEATPAAQAKTIASATTTDFRVVVSATNLGGGGGAPEAAVTVRTYERSSGGWRRTNEQPLAGPYFWKTITGPLAICRLELRLTAANPSFRPHAIVQLLRSPSLGCGPSSKHLLGG